jgi:hypothetical protein
LVGQGFKAEGTNVNCSRKNCFMAWTLSCSESH